ncbi:DUF4216 domain-containing protein [Cephalotus follicularis]|uniref:DUF4216 domain-containing protein n=1 Tax=Cephalotus follicularis TaxID=3775 RepID=A0A1Q3BE32_CEPFO|nr:DUF4216 domain-containing protein [Cephalotus follicularis]
MTTQNSGIATTYKTSSYASVRNKNLVLGDVTYYGALNDMIELNYYDKCKVVNHQTGCKKDEFGFTHVNFSRLIHTRKHLKDDPFVLASQVEKVYYVRDWKDEDWHVVIRFKLRVFYDMGHQSFMEDLEVHRENNADSEQVLEDMFEADINGLSLVRNDVIRTTI